MSDPAVPTLSSYGFVEDTPTKADRVFSYFIISLYSQSNEFYGGITSLPRILQQAGDDMTRFQGDLRSKLEVYLRRYFSALVEVGISTEAIDGIDTNLNVKFNITVQSIDDAQPFNFSALGRIQNSKFTEITRIINQG